MGPPSGIFFSIYDSPAFYKGRGRFLLRWRKMKGYFISDFRFKKFYQYYKLEQKILISNIDKTCFFCYFNNKR